MSGWSRFRAVAALEFRTVLRRPLWWCLVLGAGLTVLSLSTTALLPTGDPLTGGELPFATSQHALTTFFGLSGFVVYGFFSAVLSGLSVIRDDEHKVSELLHSTPLTPREYVAGNSWVPCVTFARVAVPGGAALPLL